MLRSVFFLIFVSINQFSYLECKVGQNGTGGSILTHGCVQNEVLLTKMFW